MNRKCDQCRHGNREESSHTRSASSRRRWTCGAREDRWLRRLNRLFDLHRNSVHMVAGRTQGPQKTSAGLNRAYWRMTHWRVTWPWATFSTGSDFSQSSETPSRWTKARLANASTSVVGVSMPARFISVEANLTATSAPETLGT